MYIYVYSVYIYITIYVYIQAAGKKIETYLPQAAGEPGIDTMRGGPRILEDAKMLPLDVESYRWHQMWQ